ncbi:hypothetical protein [Streptomyces lydicus]|uniref:hypothetical protein n=1 Tax=Streptomyces lydicus TaxID=47763 RepID=UPI0037A39CC6
MAAIPLTALECTLEAERLLGQAVHRNGEDSDRAIAMANVYAKLAHVAIIRETADRTTEQ